MINIYRLARYPERDAIVFQGNADDALRFNRTFFPAKAQPSKVDSIEGGYYAFLRFQYRNDFFEPIKTFFRTNYSAPEIQMSAFKSDQALAPTWKVDIWKRKISDSIKSSFEKQGYRTRDNSHSNMVEVLPEKPSIAKDGLEVFWGCEYWIEVNEDLFARLWASSNFWFYLNEQATSLEKISRAFEGSAQITKELRSFVARSSEEQFSFLQRFVSRVGVLEDCDGIQFIPAALTASELNMETWFWIHDSDTMLKGASAYPSTFTQALFEPGGGFFHQPNDIACLVLLPETGSSSILPAINWDIDVADAARKFISQVMSQTSVPFQVTKFPVEGSLDKALEAVRIFVNRLDDWRIFCLMPTPGADTKQSGNEHLIAASQQTHRLEKELRSILKKGFTETLDWTNLADPKARPYVLHNAIMTGLYRFGAQPWQLIDVAFENDSPESTYFLGLVGNPKSGVLASVAIDSKGKLIAFAGDHPEGKGLDLSERCTKLAADMLKNGFHHTLPKPKHLIVHLSAELDQMAGAIREELTRRQVASDIISLHPNSTFRFLQSGNKQGTPSNGIAIGNVAQRTAYLMNTLAVGEKTSRDFVYPSPAPVVIHQREGTTSLKVLASHVYWLSVAHTNGLHRTVDLPITIAYAQALQKHVTKTKRSMYVTKNHNRTLFWL